MTAIAERAAAPLRVAVDGRRGVGRGTVGRALAGAGVAVGPRSGADITVYVVAETVKPEDTDAVAALPQPGLVVLNKVDLTGLRPGEPVTAARARCARLTALTGVPAEPLVGLLAVAVLDDALDDTLWAALRVLAAESGGLGSVDDFVTGPHRLPRDVRARLCDTLDLSGIEWAVAAIRRGSPTAAIRALLRRISGVDALVGKIVSVGAEPRYRRMSAAVAELEALSVAGGAVDAPIAEFLCGDEFVLARMAAAVEVIEAAGRTIDAPGGAAAGEPAAAHLRRAVTWQRRSRGPASGVYRACGGDIARGSLRLWSRAGEQR